MKSSISKVALLLLCSAFALSSCSDDDSTEKKTATVQYRILVNAAKDYEKGLDNGGIQQLRLYTEEQMEIVSEAHNTEAWTITETAETEEAAIAACDKKAIAAFDAKLPAMNEAAASIKEKFDAKKAVLQSAIATDKSTAHVIYKKYGGYLFKGAVDENPDVVVKEGMMYDLEAVGGGN